VYDIFFNIILSVCYIWNVGYYVYLLQHTEGTELIRFECLVKLGIGPSHRTTKFLMCTIV